ncbi:hypothetical protein PTSG_01034 [Salpingoeca rosetta]|uniref:RING-type E3 ubiquitin transferase n=1 Tax=Salpingoeca rosetta (strain ATCC 50818 / BSB-021) TaxID=946362 RepID=F2TY73_SALR5|nr:uncharacterized protein PTSG_01034 [Salpingoeca rosetta]EGD76332.1 hypothetical protein PTSG_01034 [Salpingoeca rosetta]|eukprot:XP_004998507.1 hypothetical protein PTSG_01034 [Salpingoeca rosetta]
MAEEAAEATSSLGGGERKETGISKDGGGDDDDGGGGGGGGGNRTCSVREEHVCFLCMGLLIPPVVLPCTHRVCEECFRRIEELSNMECPMCRRRLHVWCRKLKGSVVDQTLWEEMQRLYPKQCQAHTKDLGDLEDQLTAQPRPRLASDGEVRAEYEAEVARLEAERRAEEEASMQAIRQLAQTDDEIRKQLEEEERVKRDLEYAQRLMEEEEAASSQPSSSQSLPVTMSSTTSSSCAPGEALSAKAIEAGVVARGHDRQGFTATAATHSSTSQRRRPKLTRSASSGAGRARKRAKHQQQQQQRRSKVERRRTIESFMSEQAARPRRRRDHATQVLDDDGEDVTGNGHGDSTSSHTRGPQHGHTAARRRHKEHRGVEAGHGDCSSSSSGRGAEARLPTHTQCPICFRPIHNDLIVPHAASCTGHWTRQHCDGDDHHHDDDDDDDNDDSDAVVEVHHDHERTRTRHQ